MDPAAGVRRLQHFLGTGALICGAAGLLKGRRATIHWSALHLLPFFGAIPVNDRVVVDGARVFAAGVTAGLDGAMCLAAELRGDATAQAIQLHVVYAPEPPVTSGTPETAPTAILEARAERCVPSRRSANKPRGVSPPNSASWCPPLAINDRRRARPVWRKPRVYWRSRHQLHFYIDCSRASQETAHATIKKGAIPWQPFQFTPLNPLPNAQSPRCSSCSLFSA